MRLHLLLVRFSSLGDVVLQTAVTGWLKRAHGDRVRITFVTSREFAPLLEGHPDLHRVVVYDRRGGQLGGLVAELKRLHAENPFHLMLDLHATTRSFLLRLRLFWLPRLVVEKRRWARGFLVHMPGRWAKRLGAALLGREPHVERVPKDWQGLLLAPWEAPGGPFTSTPPAPRPHHPRPYVVFSPVASFAPKRWPLERFVELARRFLADPRYAGLDLVVLGGPGDEYCRAFDALENPRLLNLQGKTNLAASTGWAQGARLVVGNDSGMNHLAEAGGVPVVTLFGPTHEAFGFAPHLPSSSALSVPLWCRPCSNTGARPCFRGEQHCFNHISVERVYAAMESRLGTAP